MKKVISIFLALLMLFSTATVAFAADEGTTVPEASVTEETEEDDNILKDMDADEIMSLLENMSWTEIKATLKIAKIAVKLIIVLDKLGFIDLSPIRNALLDMVWSMIKDYVDTNTAEETTTTEAAVA